MIKLPNAVVALLALCLSAAAAADDVNVQHSITNDAHLIQSGKANFGLISSALAQAGFKTVSINNQLVSLVSADCSQTFKEIAELTPQERALIEAGLKLAQGQPQQPLEQPHSSSVKLTMNNHNGFSFTRYNQDIISITKPDFPSPIKRVIIDGDIVTFIQTDGTVYIMPAACLQPDDRQLVESLLTSVGEAERQSQLDMQQFHEQMQQFHENMQQFRESMRQSRNNMHQNLNLGMANMAQNFGSLGQEYHQFRQSRQHVKNRMRQSQMFSSGAEQQPIASAFAGNHPPAPPGVDQATYPFSPVNSPFYPGFSFGLR